MNHRLTGIVLAGVLLAAGPVAAHHSGAMFDRSKSVTLTGVLKQFHYVNPHGWIDLEVTDPAGKTELWSIETTAPISLRNMGLVPSALRPGDKIKVTAHPLRDGRNGGSFVDILLANGKFITTQKRSEVGLPPLPTQQPAPK